MFDRLERDNKVREERNLEMGKKADTQSYSKVDSSERTASR